MNTHDIQYVRLERGASKRLAKMPSHQDMERGSVHPPALPPAGSRFLRWLVGLFCFLFIAGVAAVLLLVTGVWSGPLQQVANDTLLRMVPPQMAMRLGETDVRLTPSAGLAVTYSNVDLSRRDGGETLARADRLAVMIDPVSILRGAPDVSGIQATGLQLHASQLSALVSNPSQVGPVIRLSELGDYQDHLFEQLRAWGAIHLYREGGLRLRINESSVLLGSGEGVRTIGIGELFARADGEGTGLVTGTLMVDGELADLEARLHVPAVGFETRAAELTATIDSLPFVWRRLPTLFSNVMEDHEPDAERPAVPTLWQLEAVHYGAGWTDNRLSIAATPENLSLKLAPGDFVPFSGTARFDYGFDDNIITLVPDRWRLGRSVFEMSGRFRDAGADEPMGASGASLAPVEFELIANEGRLSAADSPARAVRFAAKAEGLFEPGEALISFTDMQIQSDQGEAVAEGQLALAGDAPTAVFNMKLEEMSTAGLQQFWPAPVGRGARQWVLNNIAGGRVTTGEFDIVEPLRRRDPETGARVLGETTIVLEVEGVRFDTAGDLPPVRNAVAEIRAAGQVTTIALESGTVYLPSGRTAEATDGVLVIDSDDDDRRPRGALSVNVAGDAAAVGELISYHPINAQRYFAFQPDQLSGDIEAYLTMDWMFNGRPSDPPPSWSTDLNISNGASTAPIEGQLFSDANGNLNVTPERVLINLEAQMDGVPARISMTLPLGDETITAERDVALVLDDDSRSRLAPGIESIVRGVTPVSVVMDEKPIRVEADLTGAELSLPWVGWSKGPGIDAEATFNLVTDGPETDLTDFQLAGASFGANGQIEISQGRLVRARFGRAQLNANDDIAVDVRRDGPGYRIDVSGASFDARALLRTLRRSMSEQAAGDGVPISLSATVDRVTGFGSEVMRNVRIEMQRSASGLQSLSVLGNGSSGMPFSIALEGQGSERRVRLEALDAGEFLRFVDLYGQVRGGVLDATLRGTSSDALTGVVSLADFLVVNEPRLAQLASSRSGDTESLNEAVRRDIDTSEVRFDLAQGTLTFSDQGIDLSEGVMRGPLVGFALQGRVADRDGNMRLTGTFMPAYGLNSLFADIPILGLVLGNGRDRGLIGVTFLLEGAVDRPQVTVNPLSLIAPGVFRSIFEFR